MSEKREKPTQINVPMRDDAFPVLGSDYFPTTSYTLTSLYEAERALNRELVEALKEAQQFMREFEESMFLNPNSWMREPFGKVNAALAKAQVREKGDE